MDAEVWFYLIIAAISIIVSIAGKKNKQAKKVAKSYTPYSKPVESRNVEIKDLFDMFDINNNDQTSYEYKEEKDLPLDTPYAGSKDIIDTIDSSIDSIPAEEGEIATFNYNDSDISNEKKKEYVDLFNINNFDIEQAVIYSEVLKRKEY